MATFAGAVHNVILTCLLAPFPVRLEGPLQLSMSRQECWAACAAFHIRPTAVL